jgi:hypothetical protein
MGRGISFGVALLAVAALGAAPVQAATKRLRAFDSCTALVRYAQQHTRVLPPQRPTALAAPAPAAESEPAAPGASSEPAAGDASTTNVQEAGVDEPDVVKSDGRTLLAIAGGWLYAVDARAATPELLGSVRLPEGSGHELLVHDGRALVLSQESSMVVPLPRPVEPQAGAPDAPMVDLMPYGPPKTVLSEIDVRDPAAMRVAGSLTVEGSPVSARLTGETARVVVASSPPVYATPAARAKVAGWVPEATLAGPRGRTRAVRRVVPCRAIRHPARFSGAGLLSVLTVDLAKGLPAVDADALMTDAQTVYASPRSLYVATQRWDAGPGASTQIHQFDASERGQTAYQASGVVPGHLLNQFALSEHDGVLRAATTEEGAGDSESFVTMLLPRDGELARIGQVGGLGRGERIYAVRFLGPAGYVVTFRQTDPLYTLDLSQPAEPRVAGELKILGYSAYLHPIADGLLLGVGQDATEEGRVTGTQLSLFDVSDPAEPVRLHQRSLGQHASSEAEWEHHAFVWWAPTKLAVLPVTQSGFTGAIGFRVDRRGGIDEVGRLGHDDAPVRRAVVVGERLFTLSDSGVGVARLGTLAGTGWIPFPETPERR